MKLMIPYFSEPIQFEENVLNTLVIENGKLFRDIVDDLRRQVNKEEGEIVFSVNDTPLGLDGNAEVITEFLELDVNQKGLLSKAQAMLEKEAVNQQHYMETQELLSSMARYVQKLAFSCPCDIECGKLTVSNLLKMSGIYISTVYHNLLEKIIDYMSLARDLEKDKLFIMVNMRSWFTEEEMQLFIQTVMVHKYRVFLIDNREYPRFSMEKRIIIDRDLCEIS